jgi:MFS family permease
MKTKTSASRRWIVVLIFFFFMLLHQSDKLLIGPLAPNIIRTFGISKTQMGAVLTGALLVGTGLYPLWGYLYDRFARPKLLALASLIWGATTWLSALAKTYPAFLGSRASTGVDDSSYPGLHSLIADYFGPNLRGKIYGILQLTQPLGYLVGMILALTLAPEIGWRRVFYLTGSLGIILAVMIYFWVEDVPRGQAEPAFEDIAELSRYRFTWAQAKEVLKRPTMWFIFLQGFTGVFPWNVITYWFFTYLAEERGYDEGSILFTMAPVILVLASGYFLGGALGDWLFKRTLKGRILASSFGVLMGAIFLFLAFQTPINARSAFFIFMILTAIFMPISSPNVISTVQDITAPEVRSTALAIEYFIENSGAALAPLLAGIIADASNLHNAILTICITAWLLCFAFYLGALFFVEKDILLLRLQMQKRAEHEKGHRLAV